MGQQIKSIWEEIKNGVFFSSYIQCHLQSISNPGADYVGVANDDNGNITNYSRQLDLMCNTSTGFHRVFTKYEKLNNDEPQLFENEHMGRIIISIDKQQHIQKITITIVVNGVLGKLDSLNCS